MAINREIVKRSLVLVIEDGVNDDGTTKYKNRTYSGIKGDATVDNIFQVGKALGGLHEAAVNSIMLSEKAELAEEE